MSDLLESIDRLIEERHILKHPFYQAWNAGELSIQDLQGYAGQYYEQVKAFPLYLGAVYAKCDDMQLRRKVLANLIEEDWGDENHPELWLRFAEGLGVSREEILRTEMLPETREAIDTLRSLAQDQSPAAAMAAIYAYEAMVPEVSTTKIEGLKKHYGISDARTLKFFEVHQVADREHREWDRELIVAMLRNEKDAEACLASARSALDALWKILDGVETRRVAALN